MRIFYAIVACCMYGAMCGATTGAAQEMKKAQEERAEAEDAALYFRARAAQADSNLNACIQMYADASKTEDRCQRHLKSCLGVEAFGR